MSARLLSIVAAAAITASAARAQTTGAKAAPPKATPPATQQKATQQKATPAPAPQAQKQAAPSTAAKKSATAPKTPAKGQLPPAGHVGTSPIDTASGNVSIIMREVFSYSPDGRRDPFVSLLTTSDLRPAVSDLRLLGITYAPPNSSARVRDSSSKSSYSIRLGQQLGRMRVVEIRRNAVIFTVDEFGMSRQDSLLLPRDTSKTRNP